MHVLGSGLRASGSELHGLDMGCSLRLEKGLKRMGQVGTRSWCLCVVDRVLPQSWNDATSWRLGFMPLPLCTS